MALTIDYTTNMGFSISNSYAKIIRINFVNKPVNIGYDAEGSPVYGKQIKVIVGYYNSAADKDIKNVLGTGVFYVDYDGEAEMLTHCYTEIKSLSAFNGAEDA